MHNAAIRNLNLNHNHKVKSSVPSPVVKGILNPNFRPFSFELKKIRFFEINFALGFRVLLPRTLKLFEIIFPLSNLMTSSAEPQ